MENNARKNIIYSIFLILLLLAVFLYRQNRSAPPVPENEDGKMVLSGNTMGTTYRIVYLDRDKRDFKDEIDSLFRDFNLSLSTYLPDSELSRFNRGDSLVFGFPYLLPVLKKSREVYTITEGAFDPTVGPLVNAWGFGPDGATEKDNIAIDSLLQLIGYDQVHF